MVNVIRFRSLGSGSTGNAAVVESAGDHPARLLVDCGFGLKHLLARLSAANILPEQLDAIFITHEHGDHIGCAAAMAVRFELPIWMSSGTYAAIGSPDLTPFLHLAHDGEPFAVKGMTVVPFTVPHDAREPLQLTCSSEQAKIGILTDLGHATDHVFMHLEGCSALLLECNHDTQLLANSSYPDFLKQRVGGPYGHLSNDRAANIAKTLQHSGLKKIAAAHLSLQNNSPALVRTCLSNALAWTGEEIVMANALAGCDWVVS